MKPHLSTKELSRFLTNFGITIAPKTIHNWKSRGEMPITPVSIGNRIYYIKEDVIEWVNSHRNHKKFSSRQGV